MTAEIAQTIFWYVLSATFASIAITFMWKVSLHIKFDLNEYLRERRKNRERKISAIIRSKCPHVRVTKMNGETTIVQTVFSYGDGGQFKCENCGHIFNAQPPEAMPEYWKGEGKAEEYDRRQEDYMKAMKEFGFAD